MAKNSLARGTSILFAGNLLNRLIGFFFRVYLIRLIGTEGIGLYQRVTSLFFTLLIITTAGLPAAVPILVAAETGRRNYAEVHRLTRLAFGLIIFAGLIMSILTAGLAAPIVARLLGDERAFPALAAMAPALFFCAGTAILRGYFQGTRRMAPIAASQVAEEILQVLITAVLLYRSHPLTLDTAVTCLATGFVGSEIGGFLVASLAYLRCRRLDLAGAIAATPGEPQLLRQMFRLAAPMTLYRLVLSLTSSLTAILVPARLLAAGLPLSEATAQYGQLTGIAVTLVFLPTVFTQALNANLVPAIAEVAAQPNRQAVRSRIRKAVKITYLVGLPIAALISRFAGHVTAFLFRTPEAGGPLTVLAAGAVFLYLHQISSGLLNGLGRTPIPLRHTTIANAFSLTAVYYLTAVPSLGIRGAAAGLTVGYALGCLLNFRTLHRLTGSLFDVPHLIKTVASTFFAALVAGEIYKLASFAAGGAEALLLAGGTACLVYAGLLFFLRAFRTD